MVDTAPPPADQPAHVNGPASVPATPAAPEAEASDYDERGDLCDAEYSVAHTLTGHARAVSSVRFSHSGACLASASADGTARIWNTDTGACLAVLQGHTKVSALSLRCVEAMGAWAGKDFSWVGRCDAVHCRLEYPSKSPPTFGLVSSQCNSLTPLCIPPNPSPDSFPGFVRRGVGPRRRLPRHRFGRPNGAGVGSPDGGFAARTAWPHALRHVLRLQRQRRAAGQRRV